MRRLRALALNLALSIFALGVAVAIAEGVLRAFPRLLPKGVYGASHYRPDLGGSVYDDTVIYNKLHFVEREPNSEGFLDVEHEQAPRLGVHRIGFFGDSYVEAMQVPIEQVFHRLLQEKLGTEHVEVLAFGMSGWGTLHSFLTWQTLASRYDLETTIYVFVENDPGDNAAEVQGVRGLRLSPKTYATLSPLPPGFDLVTRNPPDQLGLAYAVPKFLQERLLLARLVWNRASLLVRLGVTLWADEGQQQMTSRAAESPSQDDLPSSWPAPYRERAEALASRILRHWRERSVASGRELIVLYVPRGEAQLRGELSPEDTWKPWLEATTAELGLPLLDPSAALKARLDAGDAVYDDHWSPAGHEVIAEALADSLEGRLRRRTH